MERYINANLLLQQVVHINSTVEQGVKYFNSVYNLIQKQPTADVVEVVRCKDCKHRGRWRCPMFTLAYNERIDKYVGTNNTEDDGFCYRGEKRVENE